MLRNLLLVLVTTFALPSSTQGAAYWSLQQTATGWQWVSPKSATLCKYAAPSIVSNNYLVASVVGSGRKYSSWNDWASAQNARLKSWGFTAAGQGSWEFINPNYYPADGLPGVASDNTSGHAAGGPDFIKTVNQAYGAMKCGATFYLPYGGGQIDAYDPGIASAYVNDVSAFDTSYGGFLDHVMWISPEEGDDLYGLNRPTHEDFGYIIAAHSPNEASSFNGKHTYSDQKLYAKFAMVDFLASKYGCQGTGAPISNLSETGNTVTVTTTVAHGLSANQMVVIFGSSVSGFNGVWRVLATGLTGTGFQYYNNTEKLAAANGGSAAAAESPLASDPIRETYCGSALAASSLASLNKAWGTSYATWDTSDPNGLAGITSGAYASYGKGTGFLDENGTGLLARGTSCGKISAADNWYSTGHPAIETDLHEFVGIFAGEYMRQLVTAWNQISPRPPMFPPLYDPPAYVASQVAPYLNNGDGLWVAPFAVAGEVQNIVNALGPNKTVIAVDYATADPDSEQSKVPCPQSGLECQDKQQARAAQMVSFWRNSLHLKDPGGRYAVVGLEHWGLYDQKDQGNFGLIATLTDNPYDGSASTAAATQANKWIADNTYNAPATIFDGANFEALSGGLTASCVSAASTPNWATQNGTTTTDGTCTWRNEGSAALLAETSVPATATVPNSAYGDAITPIANFLNAGLCDQ